MGAWIHIVGSLLTRTRAQTTHRVNNSAERWHRKGEKSPYPLPQGSWNWLQRRPWQAPPPPDGRWGPNLRARACAPVFRSQANCPNRCQELLEDGGPRAWEPRPSGRAQACRRGARGDLFQEVSAGEERNAGSGTLRSISGDAPRREPSWQCLLKTSSCEMCTRDFSIAHVKPMHLATKSSGELRSKHSSLKLGQVLSCPLDCSSLVLVYAFQKTVGPFS